MPIRSFRLLLPITVFAACWSWTHGVPEWPGWGFDTKIRSRPARKGSVAPKFLTPVKHGSLFGYADRRGRLSIPPRFLEAGPFEDGLAVVVTRTVPELGGRYQRRYAVIDPTGEFVIAPAFRYLSHFREGLAIASLDGVNFGYIDRAGRWALPPRYAEASDFHGGCARVLPAGGFSFEQVDRQGRAVPGAW